MLSSVVYSSPGNNNCCRLNAFLYTIKQTMKMISKMKVVIKATISTGSAVVIMSPLLLAFMLQLAIVYTVVVDSAIIIQYTKVQLHGNPL